MAPAGDRERPAAPPPAEDPAALLERFRQSGIRIDRDGRFWHEGEPVRHEGMRQTFFRWLDRLPPPDGRYILRLDLRRFVYLEVEDTPLVATSLRWQGEAAIFGLSDGSEEPLDPHTLTVDREGVLRARVRGGRIEVRLGNSAAAALGERIAGEPGRPVLRVLGEEVAIGRR